jgi:hypothetical protein
MTVEMITIMRPSIHKMTVEIITITTLFRIGRRVEKTRQNEPTLANADAKISDDASAFAA